MSCTIEKILTDAKTLLERLREHDAAAESLVDQSAALHRRVAAMREAGTALPDQVRQRYQEDASDMKDMAKYKPHILLSQENTQIRDLQQENREIESQIDRICEMGEVMRKAVQVDDDQFCKIQEKLAQLE
uniref:Suppressor of IKBKE 1 n=1 Tax=Propithecus coquereli TaxID=379532 RepID=A0A2K6F531_PROCO